MRHGLREVGSQCVSLLLAVHHRPAQRAEFCLRVSSELAAAQGAQSEEAEDLCQHFRFTIRHFQGWNIMEPFGGQLGINTVSTESVLTLVNKQEVKHRNNLGASSRHSFWQSACWLVLVKEDFQKQTT